MDWKELKYLLIDVDCGFVVSFCVVYIVEGLITTFIITQGKRKKNT